MVYYINDFNKLIKYLSSVLFADDTILCASGPDYSGLITLFNGELIDVASWTKANMLSLNVGKTFATVFSNCSHLGSLDNMKSFGV